MSLGIMVTMNQRLDAETLTIVADEFGYEVESSLLILKTMKL
jgi:translation initiation factor IF-2